MTKKPKSFRLHVDDLHKLEVLTDYFKTEFQRSDSLVHAVALSDWTQAQTIAYLIREKYFQLIDEGKIKEKNKGTPSN